MSADLLACQRLSRVLASPESPNHPLDDIEHVLRVLDIFFDLFAMRIPGINDEFLFEFRRFGFEFAFLAEPQDPLGLLFLA